MFRNIIWDFDGTLFDTYPAFAHAFRAALKELGTDAPVDRIRALASISLTHCVSTLAGEYHLDAEDVKQRFGVHYAEMSPAEQPPFPGAADICKYICSIHGKNVIVTHRGRESTARLLAAHHMTGYFACCLTGDDGYPRKPDPAAFEAVLEMCHLEKHETLAVGDRSIDVLAGQAAGLHTCLFGPAPDDVAADLVIGRLDKLYPHLASCDRTPGGHT